MRKNKKGALYDEVILFLVSSFILMILMIGLHLMVTINFSSNNSDPETNDYRTQTLDIGGYFFVEDFLGYKLNSSQKNKYSDLIDKDLDENISVEHVLTSPKRDKVEDFFHEVKDVYLDKNGEKIENYFNFAELSERDSVDNVEDYITYTYFEYKFIQEENRQLGRKCNFFISDNSKVLPIRSTIIDEEVILFSIEPPYASCSGLNINMGDYIK